MRLLIYQVSPSKKNCEYEVGETEDVEVGDEVEDVEDVEDVSVVPGCLLCRR